MLGSTSLAADIIANYTFDGTDLSDGLGSVDADENSVASDISIPDSFAPEEVTISTGNGDPAPSIGIKYSAVTDGDLSSALSNDDYISIIVTPEPGYALNLTSFTWVSTRGSKGNEYSVRQRLMSSVDGFTAESGIGYNSVFDGGEVAWGDSRNIESADLTDARFQNLQGPIEFRIYMRSHKSRSTSDYFRIDNIVIEGTTAVASDDNIVANYTFDGTDVSDGLGSVDADNNSVASDISIPGSFAPDDVTVNVENGDPAPSLGIKYSAVTDGDLDSALSNDDYISITVTPEPGYVLNLTSFTWDSTRGSKGGDYSVRQHLMSSIDGFTTESEVGYNSVFDGGDVAWGDSRNIGSADLTDARFQNLEGPIEFRIYLTSNSSQSPSHYIGIDNIVIEGTTAVASGSPNDNILANYTFDGTDLSDGLGSVDEENNSVASDISIPDSFAPEDVTMRIDNGDPAPSLGIKYSAVTDGDLDSALSNDDYISITVTPEPGYVLNLTSFTWDSTRGSKGGDYSVRQHLMSSIDGFTTESEVGYNSVFDGGDVAWGDSRNIGSADLTDARFQNLEGPIEFRIYLTSNSSQSPSHYIGIDNIVIEGTTAVAPERNPWWYDHATETADGWLVMENFSRFRLFDDSDWIEHSNLGMTYVPDLNIEGFWFWQEKLGWNWTSAEILPFVYMAEINEWIWLSFDDPGSLYTWVYRFNSGTWEKVYPSFHEEPADIYSILNRWLTETDGGLEFIEVTNLQSEGEGSLNHAINESDRNKVTIITFAVSGWIDAANWGGTATLVDKPYIWFAGQTAPSPGVAILGGTRLEGGAAHNLVFDHLRFRRLRHGAGSGNDNKDGVLLDGRNGSIENVLFRNCSFSWATDEILSSNATSRPALSSGIVVDHCLLAEGLPSHAYGTLQYGGFEIAWLNNWWGSLERRYPNVNGGAQAHIQNNLHTNCGRTNHKAAGRGYSILFNYGNTTRSAYDPITRHNIVAVVFEDGPDVTQQNMIVPPWESASSQRELYVDDSWWDFGPYGWMVYHDGTSLLGEQVMGTPDTFGEYYRSDEPFYRTTDSLLPASEVREHVTRYAGAWPMDRCPTDKRITEGLYAGTHTRNEWAVNGTEPPDDLPIAERSHVNTYPADPLALSYDGVLTNVERWLHDLHVSVGGADQFDGAQWIEWTQTGQHRLYTPTRE